MRCLARRRYAGNRCMRNELGWKNAESDYQAWVVWASPLKPAATRPSSPPLPRTARTAAALAQRGGGGVRRPGPAPARPASEPSRSSHSRSARWPGSGRDRRWCGYVWSTWRPLLVPRERNRNMTRDGSIAKTGDNGIGRHPLLLALALIAPPRTRTRTRRDHEIAKLAPALHREPR